MGWVVSFLPYAVFLACPLMMGVCLWGMRHTGSESTTSDAASTQAGPSEDRIAELEQQLATVQAELASITAASRAPTAVTVLSEAEQPLAAAD